VLTLAIDICTRMVTGCYVGLDAPSTTPAGVTFAHSVFEKDKWLADRNVDLPWPVAGMPRSVHVDNGPDFRGHDFTRALEDFSVKVIHLPIARPHYGGHIERLIGTTLPPSRVSASLAKMPTCPSLAESKIVSLPSPPSRESA
jgi:putative transposase